MSRHSNLQIRFAPTAAASRSTVELTRQCFDRWSTRIRCHALNRCVCDGGSPNHFAVETSIGSFVSTLITDLRWLNPGVKDGFVKKITPDPSCVILYNICLASLGLLIEVRVMLRLRRSLVKI